MSKLLSYILMILGLVVIALKFVFKTVFEKIPFISQLSSLWIIIIGAALIVIGFLFLRKGKTHSSEVPIYRGKEIVGYRRK